jgi:serine protease Do
MGPVAPKAPAFWIGVTVSDIEPALRSQLALPKDQGLLTLQVHEGSPAAKAEVKVHDILLSLADKPLDSREKLTETVQASGEKAVPLKLIRGGKTLTIEVTPQRRKTEKLTVNTNVVLSQPLSYYIVRPGTFVSSPVNLQEPRSVIATQAPPVKMIEPQESAELARRLTAVDEEIKQLRKTIEELSKNLKDHK